MGSEQLALVEQAEKPQAQLLIMVAPSVEKLIQASAGQRYTVIAGKIDA